MIDSSGIKPFIDRLWTIVQPDSYVQSGLKPPQAPELVLPDSNKPFKAFHNDFCALLPFILPTTINATGNIRPGIDGRIVRALRDCFPVAFLVGWRAKKIGTDAKVRTFWEHLQR